MRANFINDPRNSFHNDSDHWAYRAEECRTIADEMKDFYCRSAMYRIANEYEWMAVHCEQIKLDLATSCTKSQCQAIQPRREAGQ